MVELLHWPRDAEQREACARDRRPRLLLIEAGVTPPVVRDPEEDWIRVPADERDVFVRARRLASRAGAHSSAPTLELGVLNHRGNKVVLSEVEERIAQRLLDDFGRLVARDDLALAAWPGEQRAPRTLDAAVARARAAVAPLDLTIVAVRCRGYLLAELDAGG